jgi:hypothetical protein
MALTSAGSVTLAGLVVLQAPRAVDPHKRPRNVVFDANFYVVEGSQTVTMALLRFFAPTEMAILSIFLRLNTLKIAASASESSFMKDIMLINFPCRHPTFKPKNKKKTIAHTTKTFTKVPAGEARP